MDLHSHARPLGVSVQRSGEKENVVMLMAQRQKLRHGMDRLIYGLAEGVIEKDQFTARINRTKARIAEIDPTIAAQTSDEGRIRERLNAELRLETFNTFNQIIFGAGGTNISNPSTFGKVTTVQNSPRNCQLVLKINF